MLKYMEMIKQRRQTDNTVQKYNQFDSLEIMATFSHVFSTIFLFTSRDHKNS
jgi:hypothetical protein